MKTAIRLIIIFVLISIIAEGCSVLPANNPPTFIPEDHLPTVIALTAQAMVDQGVIQITSAPQPTPTQDSSTQTPTPTENQPSPTPDLASSSASAIDLVLSSPKPLTLPDPLPPGEIQLISPGRLSRVSSPFGFHAYLAPPSNEKEEDISYRLALYGEDGRLLVEHLFSSEAEQSLNKHLVMDVIFKIPGEAEAARLEVSSQDGFGRTSALTSTDLVLLSEGIPEIKAIQDLHENLIIQQPIPSTLIQGGVLIIQGLTRVAPQDQLLVELIDRDGVMVGSEVLQVSEENIGSGYRHFEGEVSYQVGSSSWIRVQVSARDGKFSGIQHLSSVEVLIST